MEHILEENGVKFECAVPCIMICKQLGMYQVSHLNVGEGQTELSLVDVCLGTDIGKTVMKNIGSV